MDMVELLRKVAIVPVIKMDCPEHAVPLARAIRRGGLSAVEITYRSAAAQESIRAIADEVPDLFVCAGTVLTPEQAEQAVEAGARAVISPGLNLDTVRWCIAHEVPVIPGCATPTEVEMCMREGLSLLKLFPAGIVGGVGMLKALAGPYGAVQFMPTGGVKPGNVKEYLSQKNVAACGGTWIVPMDLLEAGRFDEIEALAREAAQIRDEVR
ncbi:bifunctional 4-hydroxy-2-oxoglutarate aldolase/2-dehydro-3-deoxy-phosphogluconate aldolase [Pseudoflavonifractor sp. BIOML-A6]|jgi:2-dehydro-3-deoxyphosphogluconate aldolase/4-hydroxy-2-oxoglutarate aldolase|nr:MULTISPECIES: bifunctional 4-hydroxy-2-oxoglutarate aldolase/2-dehydro-3-deoxy-phosphogluconate aldolase [unclassified Pseudoflavonifractor]MTQ97998.1 bifunctional 4-hydroxy-2-oxoglutarate aldolase/2-dehydro-3-deoxy-phosphogluconate aldolase [Pseudoflavonifractor sp. BIOML-A16]MTR05545.1 bifunctional 4-hydroxy-2-oxoglutarate aldolase/2-dehydro-3-deoxy-phosphogluconate aldolase [Pseudoflavonifractor sp. BIOML-A15]MTR32968.1 bifunctional 4-hydroxy-2-oxoglutarate aldolase/2-dehydro-3-deoxy-phosp